MKSPIHPDEALARVLEHARAQAPSIEDVPLADALGRVLTRSLLSLVDQPPFAKAAVDGFAFRQHADGRDENAYRITAVVRAGQKAPALQPGEAVRIMTGAPVPENADGVQRVEWTRHEGDRVWFLKRESASNIIARGENARQKEPLMTPRVLMPQDLGVLAACGYARVPAARRPRVAVISTGDEIRPACIADPADPDAFSRAEAELGAASIFDSNGPQLTACAAAFGADARFLGIVPDDEERIRDAISRALEAFDAVVVSGGVSMGDFDHIPAAAARAGVTTVFHGVRMRPGMPAFFGVRGPAAFFGLPGNPVSTFVHALLLLEPYLKARMGLIDVPAPRVPVTLASKLSRKKGENVQFWPVRIRWPEGTAEPLSYHGSSMITVLAGTDALIRLEEGQTEIPPGAIVHARLVRPHH